MFAFCPDCAAPNSLQILKKNFEVIEKIVRLAGQAESEVVEHVTQDALENAVSTFDAFGREVSRVAAPRSTDPQKAAIISFQNIKCARNNIQQLFNIDIAAPLTADEWKQVVKGIGPLSRWLGLAIQADNSVRSAIHRKSSRVKSPCAVSY